MSGPHVLAIDAVEASSVAKVWEIFLSNEQIGRLYICGECKEEAKQAFFSHFPSIVAAGGAVTAPSGKLLMIYRCGVWDLPKGKQEPGETDEATALREVEEETGVHGLKIVSFLCDTHHVYTQNDTTYIKRTMWYAMEVSEEQPLTPQGEEGIEKAEWMELAKALERAKASFPSIQRVLEAYRNR